jgi:hypothetical protein
MSFELILGGGIGFLPLARHSFLFFFFWGVVFGYGMFVHSLPIFEQEWCTTVIITTHIYIIPAANSLVSSWKIRYSCYFVRSGFSR